MRIFLSYRYNISPSEAWARAGNGACGERACATVACRAWMRAMAGGSTFWKKSGSMAFFDLIHSLLFARRWLMSRRAICGAPSGSTLGAEWSLRDKRGPCVGS